MKEICRKNNESNKLEDTSKSNEKSFILVKQSTILWWCCIQLYLVLFSCLWGKILPNIYQWGGYWCEYVDWRFWQYIVYSIQKHLFLSLSFLCHVLKYSVFEVMLFYHKYIYYNRNTKSKYLWNICTYNWIISLSYTIFFMRTKSLPILTLISCVSCAEVIKFY